MKKVFGDKNETTKVIIDVKNSFVSYGTNIVFLF